MVALIRQAALGDPLVPNVDREALVADAMLFQREVCAA